MTTNNRQPLRVAVIGSGSGSNCQAIFDAIDSGSLSAEVSCVLSDVEGAGILERAETRGVPAHFISGEPFKTKLEGAAEAGYIEMLLSCDSDVVALAGFMRMVKPGLLSAFPNRVINIHPALLPAFPGLASWKQALEYGAKVTGCTVHIVDEGMDMGPILVQKSVPVLEDDTPESLHARIQEAEHEAYPEALQLIADNRITIDGRRVRIS